MKNIVFSDEDGVRVAKYTDDDGNVNVYNELSSIVPGSYAIEMQVKSLKVEEIGSAEVYDAFGDVLENPSLLTTKYRVTGIASFKSNKEIETCGFSVIGGMGNSVSEINVGIEEMSCFTMSSQDRANYKNNNPSAIFHGYDVDTYLGCYDGEWFLELSIGGDVLIRLVDGVLNHRIRMLTIGVYLKKIYTKESRSFFAFGEGPVDLFLMPRLSDGDIQNPEESHGNIKSWFIDYVTNGSDCSSTQNERTNLMNQMDGVLRPDNPEIIYGILGQVIEINNNIKSVRKFVVLILVVIFFLILLTHG